jgi:hypothetical protein
MTHTPHCIRWGSMQLGKISMNMSSYNGLPVSEHSIQVKVTVTRDEFIESLKKSGIF